jgi:hypothetical protein
VLTTTIGTTILLSTLSKKESLGTKTCRYQTAPEDVKKIVAKGTHAAATQPSLAIYKVKEDNQHELTFKIYCFFENPHDLQGELRRTWKSYRIG